MKSLHFSHHYRNGKTAGNGAAFNKVVKQALENGCNNFSLQKTVNGKTFKVYCTVKAGEPCTLKHEVETGWGTSLERTSPPAHLETWDVVWFDFYQGQAK